MIWKYMMAYMRAVMPWLAVAFFCILFALFVGAGGMYLKNAWFVIIALLSLFVGQICTLVAFCKLLFQLNPWRTDPDSLL